MHTVRGLNLCHLRLFISPTRDTTHPGPLYTLNCRLDYLQPYALISYLSSTPSLPCLASPPSHLTVLPSNTTHLSPILYLLSRLHSTSSLPYIPSSHPSFSSHILRSPLTSFFPWPHFILTTPPPHPSLRNSLSLTPLSSRPAPLFTLMIYVLSPQPSTRPFPSSTPFTHLSRPSLPPSCPSSPSFLPSLVSPLLFLPSLHSPLPSRCFSLYFNSP